MTRVWTYGVLVSYAMNFSMGCPLLKRRSIQTHIKGKLVSCPKINHSSTVQPSHGINHEPSRNDWGLDLDRADFVHRPQSPVIEFCLTKPL